MESEKTAEKIENKASVDLTEGPLFKKMLLYALPIIATGILQLFFNTADIIVVGNFASDTALAAVGATSALIHLIINLMIGLSVGAGVSAARIYGQKNDKGMEEIVHTAMLTALIGGILFGFIGVFCSKYFLVWMSTPDNVIDQATLYIKIYFIGVPFTIIYNFGAAILRAVGDTKRPLYFLIVSGVVNVVFNLIFVIVLHMDVAGVAVATVISQVLSCVLLIIYLMRVDGSHRFNPKKMRIEKYRFKQILLVGIPAGIQSILFSVSNVIIQSSVNYFGNVVISGNTAATNIEGYIHIAMNSLYHTALAFTGQHIGAKKARRIKSIALLCSIMVTVVGMVLGLIAWLFGPFLLSLYVSDKGGLEEQIISYGLIRVSYIATTYFIFGIVDVFSGLLRGMSKSLTAMLISLCCICGLRIVWIYTVFAANKTLNLLYMSYPLSWTVCLVAEIIAFFICYRKVIRKEDLKKSAKKATQE